MLAQKKSLGLKKSWWVLGYGSPRPAHVVQKLLQVLLELAEVHGGDEALAGLGQAVPGQLGDLVVDEAEDPVGQRQHALWGVAVDELRQTLLHLGRGLEVTGVRGQRGTATRGQRSERNRQTGSEVREEPSHRVRGQRGTVTWG